MKEKIDYNGLKFELTWSDQTNFEKLKNVSQAYGVLFNKKGEILIISTDEGNHWGLPGGTPEKYDKNFEETLIREISEEGDVEVENVIRLGFQNVSSLDKSIPDKQQLRYFGKIKKINKQTIDPAYNKILLRKFVKPEKFIQETGWGKIAEYVISKSVKLFYQ